MDFSVLIADLRDVAEKYKGKTTEPQVSTLAYVDMFTKILKRAQKVTDDYGDQIQVLWVALNQLAAIYKDLSLGQARDNLCRFIFGMCARTVLNIQWSQLDDDSKSKKNLCSAVENVHKILTELGFGRFQLILDLMESHWTHPVLSQIMSSDEDDIEGGLEYIQQDDPDILKLRIEIMMKENCEEFALNLCHWSLKHPSLTNDLKIKEHQIYMLYRQERYGKMQEVCESIVCHDGIKVMSHLAKAPPNQSLCIRLAQVFLIQDWVKSDRNCCTQELLKLWIHHQYLADKDEERFLDSIWTVAKVSRDTEQIGVLIEGVRKECGDMFIQLYTELCKYALNIDKGNMEIEEKQENQEEVNIRKLRISKTCHRMAFMLKEYDFRMSRISGLTAFALSPTSDNLNLVNKLYWTIKNTSAVAANSKVNPATLYEVERLLGLMRPEMLNPDYSWKQLIPICKKYRLETCKDDPSQMEEEDMKVQNSETAGFGAKSTVPNIFGASGLFKQQQQQQLQQQQKIQQQQQLQQQQKQQQVKRTFTYEPKKPIKREPSQQNTEKDIEKNHVEHLLQSRNLSKQQIEKILSDQFPRNALKDLSEGPPLSMKQLDKTIDDLKKSIYKETQCREALEKKFSTFSQAKRTAELKSKGQEHLSRQEQFQQGVLYARQHSLPSASTVTQATMLQRQMSQGSSVPPRAHSQQGHMSSPVGTVGTPPSAHQTANRISSPGFYQPQPQASGRTQSASPASGARVSTVQQSSTHTTHQGHGTVPSQSPHIPGISPSQVKGHYGSPTGSQPGQAHMQGGQKLPRTISHPNILRPADSSQQECAKIAQHIAEMHERQRKEKERLEKIRMQGRIDGTKIALNSHSVPNSNQISELLSMTIKGGKSVSLQQFQKELNSSNIQGFNRNEPVMKEYEGKNVQQQPGVSQGRKVPNTPTAGPSIKPTSEQAQARTKNMKTHKYYLTTEKAMNQLKRDPTGSINLGSSKVSIKPMFSMVVPKSMTRPEKKDELVKTVTSMVKHTSNTPVTIQPKGFPQMHRQPVPLQATPSNPAANSAISTGTMQSNSYGTMTAMSQSGQSNAQYAESNAQYAGIPQMNTNIAHQVNIAQPANLAPQASVDTLNVTPGSFLQPLLQNVSQGQLLSADNVVLSPSMQSVNLAQAPSAMPLNQQTVNQTLDFSTIDLQNLNTLATASLSMLGQPNNQTMSGLENVQQEQLQSVQQYYGGGVVDTQQMTVAEPQIIQQDTIMATPLYTCTPTGFTQQPFVSTQQPFLNTGQVLNNQQQQHQQQHQQQQMLMSPQSNVTIQQQEIPQLVTIQNVQMPGFPQSQTTDQSSVAMNQAQMGNIPSQIGSALPGVNQILNTYQGSNQQQMYHQAQQQSTSGVETIMSETASAGAARKAAQSQFLAAPELSPAVVQQILSSLKRSTAQPKPTTQCDMPAVSSHPTTPNSSSTVIDNRQSQIDAKIKESEATIKESLKQFLMKKDDPNVKQSILEATQKIMQLRKQYKQYTSSENSGPSSHQTHPTKSIGGLLKHMMETEDDLKTIMQQGKSKELKQKSASVMKPTTLDSQTLPDLPDLGASEIDSILGAVGDSEFGIMQEESSRKKALIQSQSRYPTEMPRQVSGNFHMNSQQAVPSHHQSTISAKSNEVPPYKGKIPLQGSDAEKQNFQGTVIERNVQSTYMNANRIAKEREEKTQHSGMTAIQSNTNAPIQSKERLFPAQNCSCMLYKEHLNSSVDKKHCNCSDTKILPQQIPSDQVLKNNEMVACGICFKKFNSLSAIKDHVKKSCTSPSSVAMKSVQLKDFEYSVTYKCTNCNFMNGNEKISTKHVENCSSNVTSSPVKAQLITLYKCRMCSDMFSDKQSTYRHVSKLCPKLKVVSTHRDVQDNYQKLKSANKLQVPASGEMQSSNWMGIGEHKHPNSSGTKQQSSDKTKFEKLASTDSNAETVPDKTMLVNKIIEDSCKKSSFKIPKGGLSEVATIRGNKLLHNVVTKENQDYSLPKTVRKANETTARIVQKDSSLSKSSPSSLHEVRKAQHKLMSPAATASMPDSSLANSPNDNTSQLRYDENNPFHRAKMDQRNNEKYYLEQFNAIEERKRKDRRKEFGSYKKHTSEQSDDRPVLKSEDGSEIMAKNEKRKTVLSNEKESEIEANRERKRKVMSEGDELEIQANREKRKKARSDMELNGDLEKTTTVLKETKELHDYNSSDDNVNKHSFRKKSRHEGGDKVVVKKVKGQREKRIIKKQKFLIDEMGYPSVDKKKSENLKSNDEVSEDENDEIDIETYPRWEERKSQWLEKIDLPKGRFDHPYVCHLCDYECTDKYCNSMVKHYVQKHNLGCKLNKHGFSCLYCKENFPEFLKKPLTAHVVNYHKDHLYQLIVEGKFPGESLICVTKSTGLKDKCPTEAKTDTKRSRISTEKMSKHLKSEGKSPKQPKTGTQRSGTSTEKMSKHLKAVAMRKRCAENLKKIANQRASVDRETSENESERDTTEITEDSGSDISGLRKLRKVDHKMVMEDKEENTVSDSSEASSSDMQNDRLKDRSRSSSLSSRSSRSDIAAIVKRLRKMPRKADLEAISGEAGLMLTRSGRTIRKLETDSSYEFETSDENEDYEGEEDTDDDSEHIKPAKPDRRRSLRTRRLSEKGNISQQEVESSNESSAEEVVPRVTRSASLKSGEHRRESIVCNNQGEEQNESGLSSVQSVVDHKNISNKTTETEENKINDLTNNKKYDLRVKDNLTENDEVAEHLHMMVNSIVETEKNNSKTDEGQGNDKEVIPISDDDSISESSQSQKVYGLRRRSVKSQDKDVDESSADIVECEESSSSKNTKKNSGPDKKGSNDKLMSVLIGPDEDFSDLDTLPLFNVANETSIEKSPINTVVPSTGDTAEKVSSNVNPKAVMESDDEFVGLQSVQTAESAVDVKVNKNLKDIAEEGKAKAFDTEFMKFAQSKSEEKEISESEKNTSNECSKDEMLQSADDTSTKPTETSFGSAFMKFAEVLCGPAKTLSKVSKNREIVGTSKYRSKSQDFSSAFENFAMKSEDRKTAKPKKTISNQKRNRNSNLQKAISDTNSEDTSDYDAFAVIDTDKHYKNYKEMYSLTECSVRLQRLDHRKLENFSLKYDTPVKDKKVVINDEGQVTVILVKDPDTPKVSLSEVVFSNDEQRCQSREGSEVSNVLEIDQCNSTDSESVDKPKTVVCYDKKYPVVLVTPLEKELSDVECTGESTEEEQAASTENGITQIELSTYKNAKPVNYSDSESFIDSERVLSETENNDVPDEYSNTLEIEVQMDKPDTEDTDSTTSKQSTGTVTVIEIEESQSLDSTTHVETCDSETPLDTGDTKIVEDTRMLPEEKVATEPCANKTGDSESKQSHESIDTSNTELEADVSDTVSVNPMHTQQIDARELGRRSGGDEMNLKNSELCVSTPNITVNAISEEDKADDKVMSVCQTEVNENNKIKHLCDEGVKEQSVITSFEQEIEGENKQAIEEVTRSVEVLEERISIPKTAKTECKVKTEIESDVNVGFSSTENRVTEEKREPTNTANEFPESTAAFSSLTEDVGEYSQMEESSENASGKVNNTSCESQIEENENSCISSDVCAVESDSSEKDKSQFSEASQSQSNEKICENVSVVSNQENNEIETVEFIPDHLDISTYDNAEISDSDIEPIEIGKHSHEYFDAEDVCELMPTKDGEIIQSESTQVNELSEPTQDEETFSESPKTAKISDQFETKQINSEIETAQINEQFGTTQTEQRIDTKQTRKGLETSHIIEESEIEQSRNHLGTTHSSEKAGTTLAREQLDINQTNKHSETTHISKELQTTQAREELDVTEASKHSDTAHTREESERTQTSEKSRSKHVNEESETIHANKLLETTHTCDQSQTPQIIEQSETATTNKKSETVKLTEVLETSQVMDQSGTAQTSDRLIEIQIETNSELAQVSDQPESPNTINISVKPSISEQSEETQIIEESDFTQTSDQSENIHISEQSDETQISQQSEKTKMNEQSEKTQINKQSEETGVIRQSEKTPISEQSEKSQIIEQSETAHKNEQLENIEISEQSEETEISEHSEEISISEQSERTQVNEQSEKAHINEQSEETEISEQSEEMSNSEQSEKTQINEQSEEIEIIEQSEEISISEQSEMTQVNEQSEKTQIIKHTEMVHTNEQSENIEICEQSEETEMIEQSETTQVNEQSEKAQINEPSGETEIIELSEQSDKTQINEQSEETEIIEQSGEILISEQLETTQVNEQIETQINEEILIGEQPKKNHTSEQSEETPVNKQSVKNEQSGGTPITEQPEKTIVSNQSETTQASDQSETTQASNQSEKTEASNRLEKTEASNWSEKTEASSQSEKTEASNWPEKTEASSQSEKTEASNRSEKTEASSQSENTETSSQSEKTKLCDQSEEIDITDISEIEINTQSEKTQISDKSEETENDYQSEDIQISDKSDNTQICDQSEKTQITNQSEETDMDNQSEKTQITDQSEETEICVQPEETEITDLSETKINNLSEETEICVQPEETEINYQSEKTQISDQSEETEICVQPEETEINYQSENTQISDQSEETEICVQPEETEINYQSEKTEISDHSDETQITDLSKTKINNLSEKTQITDQSEETDVDNQLEKTHISDQSEETVLEKAQISDQSEETEINYQSEKTEISDQSDNSRICDQSEKKQITDQSEETEISDQPEETEIKNQSEEMQANEDLKNTCTQIRKQSEKTEINVKSELKHVSTNEQSVIKETPEQSEAVHIVDHSEIIPITEPLQTTDTNEQSDTAKISGRSVTKHSNDQETCESVSDEIYLNESYQKSKFTALEQPCNAMKNDGLDENRSEVKESKEDKAKIELDLSNSAEVEEIQCFGAGEMEQSKTCVLSENSPSSDIENNGIEETRTEIQTNKILEVNSANLMVESTCTSEHLGVSMETENLNSNEAGDVEIKYSEETIALETETVSTDTYLTEDNADTVSNANAENSPLTSITCAVSSNVQEVAEDKNLIESTVSLEEVSLSNAQEDSERKVEDRDNKQESDSCNDQTRMSTGSNSTEDRLVYEDVATCESPKLLRKDDSLQDSVAVEVSTESSSNELELYLIGKGAEHKKSDCLISDRAERYTETDHSENVTIEDNTTFSQESMKVFESVKIQEMLGVKGDEVSDTDSINGMLNANTSKQDTHLQEIKTVRCSTYENTEVTADLVLKSDSVKQLALEENRGKVDGNLENATAEGDNKEEALTKETDASVICSNEIPSQLSIEKDTCSNTESIKEIVDSNDQISMNAISSSELQSNTKLPHSVSLKSVEKPGIIEQRTIDHTAEEKEPVDVQTNQKEHFSREDDIQIEVTERTDESVSKIVHLESTMADAERSSNRSGTMASLETTINEHSNSIVEETVKKEIDGVIDDGVNQVLDAITDDSVDENVNSALQDILSQIYKTVDQKRNDTEISSPKAQLHNKTKKEKSKNLAETVNNTEVERAAISKTDKFTDKGTNVNSLKADENTQKKVCFLNSTESVAPPKAVVEKVEELVKKTVDSLTRKNVVPLTTYEKQKHSKRKKATEGIQQTKTVKKIRVNPSPSKSPKSPSKDKSPKSFGKSGKLKDSRRFGQKVRSFSLRDKPKKDYKELLAGKDTIMKKRIGVSETVKQTSSKLFAKDKLKLDKGQDHSKVKTSSANRKAISTAVGVDTVTSKKSAIKKPDHSKPQLHKDSSTDGVVTYVDTSTYFGNRVITRRHSITTIVSPVDNQQEEMALGENESIEEFERRTRSVKLLHKKFCRPYECDFNLDGDSPSTSKSPSPSKGVNRRQNDHHMKGDKVKEVAPTEEKKVLKSGSLSEVNKAIDDRAVKGRHNLRHTKEGAMRERSMSPTAVKPVSSHSSSTSEHSDPIFSPHIFTCDKVKQYRRKLSTESERSSKSSQAAAPVSAIISENKKRLSSHKTESKAFFTTEASEIEDNINQKNTVSKVRALRELHKADKPFEWESGSPVRETRSSIKKEQPDEKVPTAHTRDNSCKDEVSPARDTRSRSRNSSAQSGTEESVVHLQKKKEIKKVKRMLSQSSETFQEHEKSTGSKNKPRKEVVAAKVSQPKDGQIISHVSKGTAKTVSENDNKVQHVVVEKRELQNQDRKRGTSPSKSRRSVDRPKSNDVRKTPTAELKPNSSKIGPSKGEDFRGRDTNPKRKATDQMKANKISKVSPSSKTIRSRSRSRSQDKSLISKLENKKSPKEKVVSKTDKGKVSDTAKTKPVAKKQTVNKVKDELKSHPKSKVTSPSGKKAKIRRSKSPGKGKVVTKTKAQIDSNVSVKCKLDGTTNSPTSSPVKDGSSESCQNCRHSESRDDCIECGPNAALLKGQKYIYESKRAPVRQIIHKGKVFEIQKGLVTESDIQWNKLSEKPESREISPVRSTTSPPSKSSANNMGLRTRSSTSTDTGTSSSTRLRKRAHSPDSDINEKNVISSRKINSYISETLKRIGIERQLTSPPQKWTVQKKTVKGPKFPYSFKKSRKN